MQATIHYFLHLVFPFLIALIFFKKDWQKVSILLLLTMLVDLDHLFALPIFESNRCSIGFHPLHSYLAIALYVLLLFKKGNIRIIGLGLLFHMFTDLVDCLFMFNSCSKCLEDTPAFGLLATLSDFLRF